MKKIALSVLLSFNVFASVQTGQELMDFFSSTCPSQGEWTRRVSEDAQGLIRVLENIKNDANCSSVAGSIAQLQQLTQSIHLVNESNERKIQLERLKAQEFELSTQLAATANPLIQDEIQRALRDVQVQKAMLLAENSARTNLSGDNVADLMSNVVLSTDAVYKTLANNTLCLQKNPSVLSTLTALTSSIGSSAAMINPALGLGMGAFSEFLGSSIEYARNRSINRQIRRISNETLMFNGLSCAMESLNNRWCEIGEARKVLEFKFELHHSEDISGDLLQGVELFENKIPAFLGWLLNVRSGSPPATDADAIRFSNVYKREEMTRSAEAVGAGEFNSNRRLFEAAGAERRLSILKSVVANISGQSCSGSAMVTSTGTAKNPLFDIYPESNAPWLLLGLPASEVRTGFNAINFCSFNLTQWNQTYPNHPLTATLGSVERNFVDWINQAKALVADEMIIVLQPDALGILSLAFERTGNNFKIAPKIALDEILSFLKTNQPQFAPTTFSRLYKDTIERLEIIQDELNSMLVSGDIDAQAILKAISDTADLQYGTIVLSSRLEMIVRLALDEYLQNNRNEDPKLAMQFFAAENYLDVLRKVMGHQNDETMMEDIRGASMGAISNMKNFASIFSVQINRILESNSKALRTLSDPTKLRTVKENHNRFCLLLASFPELNRSIKIHLCEGAKMESYIRGGPESRLVDRAFLQSDFTSRQCEYRNFLNKSKIYREWNIKL